MSDDDISVNDPNQWKIKTPEYICDVHGNIGEATISISISGGPTSHHCILCLRDLLPAVELIK